MTDLLALAGRRKWRLLGIDFHGRWRAGRTWLDSAGGDHLWSHHGFYSIEWARGPHLEYYRGQRRARASMEADRGG
ncbi:MAG: hypothetical protein JWP25_3591 [Bradyrhizobium sp.]|nr:hypothetical protein [Bradyrhizobium sp.]